MENQSFGFVAIIIGIIYLALIILTIAGIWKLFEKAGKPGWASIIPIYSTIVMQEIVGRETWKIILLFIPIVNIYFLLTLLSSFAKSYGKGGVGNFILLLFFGYIVLPMWGFSNEVRYVGPVESQPAPSMV
ncbi:DUF5684 domain-containing protein [Hymenobacter sp. ASUV-10]|uniref:DUF5684 domain-containing protein n=1 Tax=Hymenobacter aranciens TaxID=3063996 RepID=A0ABT9BA59_9BACT|nr:DUF5684 domain-containing protein [Hymenobacter sp. ASUV-10]MDO7873581.1 DUF5684 domain-containing protein [Hymenobacter sp. ASUV-10]